MDTNVIILAAGKGTRMNSDLPKCAHNIIDKPMIDYVIKALDKIKPTRIITVVGYKREVLELIINDRTEIAIQDQQLGTGHAVMVTEPLLKDSKGDTVIAIGDMPFVGGDTYFNLLNYHRQEKADLTILTTTHPNPAGYGRIVRDNNNVVAIVEEKDCTKEQRLINEINASIYVVNNEKLFKHLGEIRDDNNQQEYYLTDLVEIFIKHNYKVNAYKSADFHEISGVNDKYQLVKMEEDLQRRIIEKHLLSGVTIKGSASVVIGADVIIEKGVTILPNTVISGQTIIERNCKVGPNSEIINSHIKEGSVIRHSVIESRVIESFSKIGPFEYIK